MSEYRKWDETVGAHARQHGCGCTHAWDCRDPNHADGHRYHGLAYCPEAIRLLESLDPTDVPPTLG